MTQGFWAAVPFMARAMFQASARKADACDILLARENRLRRKSIVHRAAVEIQRAASSPAERLLFAASRVLGANGDGVEGE